ncbi:hypothetical protein DRO19_03720 [Candidatus Bathyarchaeota archaeon]|nr:MAG: hypothetical protein DRO19_03720 [Candidatus Bathyarchaeota archaeon]
MEMNYKKLLKISVLLLSSLIIGAVSAASYGYLYIQGTVTVGTRNLQWVKDGNPVTGDTVSITLNVEQYTPTNITGHLYLNNTGSNSYSLTLTVTSAASSKDFDNLTIYVYGNGTGSWQPISPDNTLDALTEGDSFSATINAHESFRFDFWVNATTTNGGTFEITVEYPTS